MRLSDFVPPDAKLDGFCSRFEDEGVVVLLEVAISVIVRAWEIVRPS